MTTSVINSDNGVVSGTSGIKTTGGDDGALNIQSNGTTIFSIGSSAATFAKGITETVYALGTSGSLALSPANGTVQTCALSGNPTFTDSLSAGQSIVLMLTNGASYTVTWPTITWVTSAGNAAPTLTAADTLVFWKISTTLYGAYVGSYV